MSPKLDSLSEAHFSAATCQSYFRGDNRMSKLLNDMSFFIFSKNCKVSIFYDASSKLKMIYNYEIE